MRLDVSSALPYGKLERDEVYFEHDGPRFFALRSITLGVRLLALCIEDDDEADEVVFLYLVLSPRRFAEVRSGHIPLRQAFEQAGPSEIWRVVEDFAAGAPSVRAEAVRLQDLAEEDLPSPTARLELHTPTAPELDEGELRSWSEQTLRTVAAVELEASGENLTEFPLRGLGHVGTTLQDTVDALAQEEVGEPTERGPIPRSVTDDVQMAALALRAASFALVIGTDKRGRLLVDERRVEATLGRLADLISQGSQPDQLVVAMRGYGTRARGKFTSLLRAVAGNGSGIGLVTAPVVGASRTARMTATQVRLALQSIDQVEASSKTFTVPRAILTGSHTRLGNFELTDMASLDRYSGKVAPEARSQIDGLAVGHASYVSADIRQEIDFAAEDQETGRRYILLGIRALDEPE